MYDIEKLRRVFPDTTIYKDKATTAIFRAAKIDSFLRDWIIKRKAGPDGRIEDTEKLAQYIAKTIPNTSQKMALEDEARTKGETRSFLAKVNVEFRSRENYYSFEIPDLGFRHTETIIEDYVWERVKDQLIHEAGGWGMVKLGYAYPDENKKNGRFTLLEYKNFRPYQVNLDAFRAARAHYDVEEWTDVLLGAIDYDPDGFRVNDSDHESWLWKHTLLTRLLPFVQPRVNMIELAKQQTGKSYVFGKIGKYGWLSGGGKITRAKLFTSMVQGAKPNGLVTFNDFVAIDEVKSINFGDDLEMSGILKGYMEDGSVKVGNTKVEGEAGIIFLGNIDPDDMGGTKDMFKELPDIFRDSALLQRIHGIIPAQYTHAISPSMIINDWALNSEYFTEIMHMMRSREETMRYSAFVEDLVEVRAESDLSHREKEAVFRLCTAYLKLFFPHVDEEMTRDTRFLEEFDKYCLRPAVAMQETVLNQMKIINPNEFKDKAMASYGVKVQ
jgi:ATP-dependent Lon protease